jgi:hypothetical protein
MSPNLQPVDAAELVKEGKVVNRLEARAGIKAIATRGWANQSHNTTADTIGSRGGRLSFSLLILCSSAKPDDLAVFKASDISLYWPSRQASSRSGAQRPPHPIGRSSLTDAWLHR